jgi:hypothetical protein
VILSRSTPYSVARIPLVQTPVVTVYARTPTFLPSEILRRLHAGVNVIDDRRVVKLAHDENRERGERFAVGLGGQVGRNGHLAEVEL